jgi:ABC-type polysaccharide/polyol phosphate export permease
MFTQVQHLWRYREAVRLLVRRDLTVRYSGSVLGVIWSLVSPLMMTVVYTLVFAFLLPSGIEKFPVFVLVGILPWLYFTNATLGAGSSITGNGSLITRVYFPRDILPLSVVLANLINFIIALSAVVGLVVIYGVPITPAWWWLPVMIVFQTGLCLGCGLLLGVTNVYFRDAQQIVEIILQAGFFLTPIVYPLEYVQDPFWRTVMTTVNPMAAVVQGYREIIYAGRAPEPMLLGVLTFEILLCVGVGYWLFHRTSPAFAEKI